MFFEEEGSDDVDISEKDLLWFIFNIQLHFQKGFQLCFWLCLMSV